MNRTKPFKVNDQVWLESKNLKIPYQSRKLAPKREGPFKIKEVLGPVTYWLTLPKQWKIHDVFHACLLTPYKETHLHGNNETRPPPNLVEGNEEYEVEAILSHRLHKNCETTYLIKWKGYNSSENSWEPKSNLTNAEEELDDYKRCGNIQWRQQPGHIYTTSCSRIHTDLHRPTCYHTPLPTYYHLLIWCQKVTMNRKLDLPIPMRPSTPSNLRSMTLTENGPPSPTFDEKILPSHWMSDTCQVIKKTMEDLLRLKKILESAIQSLKCSLPMSHLLPEQQNKLIEALLQAVEQFKNVQDSTCPFAKYLKKEDRYIIKALITSELLMKSLTELLTSPVYLEYSLNQQKNDT